MWLNLFFPNYSHEDPHFAGSDDCLRVLYATAEVSQGSTMREALGKGRIVAIDQVSPSQIKVCDGVDGCFGALLNRNEVRAWANELNALADDMIDQ